jgi:hypothetical protein
MRAPLACAAATLIAGAVPSAVQAQSMLDQIVIKKCTAAMQADFEKAGKTPPAGLIQRTCSCVASQVEATHNIEMAKTICTQQAQSEM